MIQRNRMLAYTRTAFAIGILSISSLLTVRPEAASAQFGKGCNIFGCAKPGASECGPFGCPNPGAGDCTALGCPESPPSKPDDGSNRPDDRGRRDRFTSDRPISGECMDRIMYQEVRASSDHPVDSAVYKGYYLYSLPIDSHFSSDAVREAGFASPSPGA